MHFMRLKLFPMLRDLTLLQLLGQRTNGIWTLPALLEFGVVGVLSEQSFWTTLAKLISLIHRL